MGAPKSMTQRVLGGNPPPTDDDAGGKLRACESRVNCLCTDHGDADPIPYGNREPDAMRTDAAREVGRLSGARVVSFDGGRLHAECRSRLFKFVDDLELRFDDDAKVVHVRSASRLGRGDLGVNRRRVERLRRALA